MTIRSRKPSIAVSTLLLSSLLVPTTHAEVRPGSASIVLGVDNLTIDDSRNLDSGLAIHLLIGYAFNKRWGVEAGVRKGSFESSSGMLDHDVTVAHFDAIYNFNGDGSWVPFLSAGVGSSSYDNGAITARSEFLSFGAGIKWYMTDSLLWRTDLRTQFQPGPSTFDWSVGTGLGYQFGGYSEAEVSLAPTDSDTDGINDAEDHCPNTPTGKTVDQRGCPATAANNRTNVAIPKQAAAEPKAATPAPAVPAKAPAAVASNRYADDDNDGIPNAADDCQGTPEGAAVTLRGCVRNDADGDQIPDAADKCGGTKAGQKVNPFGCSLEQAAQLAGTAQPATPKATPVPVAATPTRITRRTVAPAPIATPKAAQATTQATAPTTAAADSDKDGVMDAKDRCPETPEGIKVDLLGCPAVIARTPAATKAPVTRRAVAPVATTTATTAADEIPIAKTEPVPPGWKPSPREGDVIQSRFHRNGNTSANSTTSQRRWGQTQATPRHHGEAARLLERKIFNGNHFKPNSSYLTNEAKGAIESFSYRVINKPIGRIIVMGHTDSHGSEKYNEWMSARRASHVAKYLISIGFPADKIEVYGFGESKPLADNSTARGRATNRRVEVFVFGEGKQQQLPRRYLIDMRKGVSATPPAGSVRKRTRKASAIQPKRPISSPSLRCGFGNRSADCKSGQKFKL